MTLDTDIASSVDLFGLHIDDLQTDTAVSGDTVSGTLKYVTGYTGFSTDPALQQGNYLAFHVGGDLADCVVKCELVGGVAGEITMDADRIGVWRITDATTQELRVTATYNGHSAQQTYKLTGLTLEAE